MIQVPLTQGKFSIIDDNNSNLLEFKWYFLNIGYAARTFRKENNKTGIILLHHAIMGVPLYGLYIDHRNGFRLDNRKENLHIVSNRQNQQNQLIHRNGKLPGAYFCKDRTDSKNPWIARYSLRGKNVYVGRFSSEKEANAAYLKAIGPFCFI